MLLKYDKINKPTMSCKGNITIFKTGQIKWTKNNIFLTEPKLKEI